MASVSDIAAEEIAKTAKAAFEASQLLPTAVRVDALAKIRQQLEANKAEILAANKQDMEVQRHFSVQDTVILIYQGGASRGSCR